eukprot:CAMPEP_0176142732 /NCGR_PEP_ID=MMETSP0120_2-20121206/72629_1 /TAXON_ID=160619 /ORGANISM="Kryptoperidinium foliaceum, Strain CCMP 1326" /LENGTH=47 /DNA_ID= /DNA_START= /DNA_END= /DNA_ORIENTATION=
MCERRRALPPLAPRPPRGGGESREAEFARAEGALAARVSMRRAEGWK